MKTNSKMFAVLLVSCLLLGTAAHADSAPTGCLGSQLTPLHQALFPGKVPYHEVENEGGVVNRFYGAEYRQSISEQADRVTVHFDLVGTDAAEGDPSDKLELVTRIDTGATEARACSSLQSCGPSETVLLSPIAVAHGKVAPFSLTSYLKCLKTVVPRLAAHASKREESHAPKNVAVSGRASDDASKRSDPSSGQGQPVN